MGAYNIVNPAGLVSGQPEDISVVLANLQAIQTILNGGIDNSNVSAAAALAISKLAGYPANAGLILKGDGTWGTSTGLNNPKVTTSTLAGGPPASPADGDMWVATAVNGGTKRWIFQYDAAEATYKWKFLGGPSVGYYDGATFRQNTISGVWQQVPGSSTIAIARAGLYKIRFGGSASTSSGNLFYLGIGPTVATILNGYQQIYESAAGDTIYAGIGGEVSMTDSGAAALSASSSLVLQIQSASFSASGILFSWFSVEPEKII